ncbi:MAG: hypothetical protein ABS78_23035 [Phenylobacterium sp. SCN 70-31]|nr:MAG: hypothetical protein ABS78_23035 [Phenylobacterium sp. SCN 70-31]
MPLYTFYLCDDSAQPYTFEANECSQDSEVFRKANELLQEHPRAHFVTVWESERAVLACHREEPVLRAVPQVEIRHDA